MKCEENWRIAKDREKRWKEQEVKVEEKIKVKIKREKRGRWRVKEVK